MVRFFQSRRRLLDGLWSLNCADSNDRPIKLNFIKLWTVRWPYAFDLTRLITKPFSFSKINPTLYSKWCNFNCITKWLIDKGAIEFNSYSPSSWNLSNDWMKSINSSFVTRSSHNSTLFRDSRTFNPCLIKLDCPWIPPCSNRTG